MFVLMSMPMTFVTFEESGCTDASACNYDDVAQVDDGSCDYCCGYEVFTSTEAGYGVSIDLVQTHTSGHWLD